MVGKHVSVLIVDDDPAVCDLLVEQLGERGYQCSAVLDGNAALEKLVTRDFDVALLDIKLPGTSGMELLKTIAAGYPNTVAIMVTVVCEVDTAVEAMELGAADYVAKPFHLDRLDAAMRRALSCRRVSLEGLDLESIVGSSNQQRNGQVATQYLAELNVIAKGVEAKLDWIWGHSIMVTHETTKVARRLRIPEPEIQNWAAVRSTLHYERERGIKSLLQKVGQNPPA